MCVNGTVNFSVCGPAPVAPDCSTGGTAVGGAVTVSGGSATSAAFTPTTAGVYCFRATYTQAAGSNYLTTAHTNSTTECFALKAAPGMTTQASAQAAFTGQSLTDTATLTQTGQLGTVSGTVSFFVCGPAVLAPNCATGGDAVGSAVTVSGGNATSSAFEPTAAAPLLPRRVRASCRLELPGDLSHQPDHQPDWRRVLHGRRSGGPGAHQARRVDRRLEFVRLRPGHRRLERGISADGYEQRPVTEHSFTITDTLPSGFTFTSTGSSIGCTSGDGTTVVCVSAGVLADDASVSFVIAYTVDAGITNGSTRTNTATVTGTPLDTTPGNNTATQETTVNASADLSVTKTDNQASVTAGDGVTYTYTIVVTNDGPSTATGVGLSDTWPTGFDRGTVIPSQGS